MTSRSDLAGRRRPAARLDPKAVVGMRGRRRRRFVFLVLRVSLLPLATRRFVQRRRTTILLYHAPSPEVIDRHFQALARLYNPISLREFTSAHMKGALDLLPRRSIVITLDDGHRSNAHLLPVLARWPSIPVTIFACRRFHDSNAPTLTGSQIDRLLAFADIQPHTVSHVDLTRASTEEARTEISEGRRYLEERHSVDVYAFAYPNGWYTERDVALLQECGYTYALTTAPGFNSQASDRFRLRRIGIPDDAGIDELIVKSSGVWAVLGRLAPHGR